MRNRGPWLFVVLASMLLACAGVWAGMAGAPPAPTGAEQVVLLHGLGRTRASMWYLERSLESAGYRVHNIGYASLDEDLDEIVDEVGRELDRLKVRRGPTVHFVAHSLGGLVVRAYLAKRPPPRNLGRVVLLATPNKGSPVIDRMRAAGFSIVPIGPTGRALGSGAEDLPAQLPDPYYDVGVIAGTRDVMVPPANARLDVGETDYVEINTGHMMMRYNREVAEQTVRFLRDGRFKR